MKNWGVGFEIHRIISNKVKKTHAHPLALAPGQQNNGDTSLFNNIRLLRNNLNTINELINNATQPEEL